MKGLKNLTGGILIGLLLAGMFSTPWIAHAVGNCSTFRSWNTGDAVTAGDLNQSFTTAAVTNSTMQCVDDFSATVNQMQSTDDPYPSGTESLATSAAEEIERLRFMFKRIFGLTEWYRHDQAPMFSASHIGIAALHLGSSGVPGGTDAEQNQQLSRFPVLTGPDHWTGIWWPHNTAHMAISIRDANHAAGGVQGGIELFRFHAGGLTLHHTAALRFRHVLADNGGTTHVTALSLDSGTGALILGHAGATLRVQGSGIVGGTNQALLVASDGTISSGTSGGGSLPIYILRPTGATFPSELFPTLARHSLANSTSYGLMYHAALAQTAHFSAVMPTGISIASATIEVFSRQGTETTGTIGWHVGVRSLAHAAAFDGTYTVHTVYPQPVENTAGNVLRQTEDITNTLSGGEILQVYIQKNSASTVTEATTFIMAVIRLQ